MKYLRQLHHDAKEISSFERYMQSSVHNYEELDSSPKWKRWLDKQYLFTLGQLLYYEAKRVLICSSRGHDFEDTGSWANGDSGGEDLTCKRCGFHFHHVYY